MVGVIQCPYLREPNRGLDPHPRQESTSWKHHFRVTAGIDKRLAPAG